MEAPFESDREKELYEQNQDALRRLFGKRSDLRGVKLTPAQEAAKVESNDLEREIGTGRLCEIHNFLVRQDRTEDAERCRTAREATRKALAEKGLREGQKMTFNGGGLGSLLGGRTGYGVLKIAKRGDPYVSYGGRARDPGYWSPAA